MSPSRYTCILSALYLTSLCHTCFTPGLSLTAFFSNPALCHGSLTLCSPLFSHCSVKLVTTDPEFNEALYTASVRTVDLTPPAFVNINRLVQLEHV